MARSRGQPAKTIKSAKRVFEILEYFDADHFEASVSEIAARYGYPQSSTSELLNCMADLGYLRRGRDRTFRLSVRAAMLGSGIQPELVRSGRLLQMMDALRDETGATVVLATHAGVKVHCVNVLTGRDISLNQGDELSMLHTAEGRALLLACNRTLVRGYLHRLNSEAANADDCLRFPELAAELDAAAARGYVRLLGERTAAVAMLVPSVDQDEPLAIGVRTPRADFSEDALVQLMRSTIARTLGLVRIPSSLRPADIVEAANTASRCA